MRLIACVLLVLTAGLSGCQKSEFFESFIAEDIRAPMRDVLDAVQARDSDRLIAHFGPQADTDAFRAELDTFFGEIPQGRWQHEPEVAGAHRNWSQTFGEEKQENQSIVLTTETDATPVRIDLVFTRIGEAPWRLQNINIHAYTPNPGILGNQGDMTHARLAATALALTSLALILFTLVASFRFKRIKHRILWSLFIVVGYPAFAFDWTEQAWRLVSPSIATTGNGWNVSLLNISFFGAGLIDNTPVEPAVISVGVPIGALLFWYRVMRGGPTRKAGPVPD